MLSDEEQLNVEDDDEEEAEIDISSDPVAMTHAHSGSLGNPLHPLMYSHAVSMATANQLHYTAAAALQQRNHRDNADVISKDKTKNDVTLGDHRFLRDSERNSPRSPSSVQSGQTGSQKRPGSPTSQQHQSHTNTTIKGQNPLDSQPKKARLEFSLPPTHPANHIERWQLTATGHV